jgi:hypothetical protein
MLEAPTHLPLLIIPDGGIKAVVLPRLAKNTLAPYESAWSLAAKTAAANAFTAIEVSRLFGISSRVEHPLIYGGAPRAVKLLKENLNISVNQINHAFVDNEFKVFRQLMAKELRFCPVCSRLGHHFIIHQLKIFSSCPLHDTPLRSHCARCGKLHLYELGNSNIYGPINCTECGTSLLPVTHGGYPKTSKMSLRTAQVLTRYMSFLSERTDAQLLLDIEVVDSNKLNSNYSRELIPVISPPKSVSKKLLASVIIDWSSSPQYRCLEQYFWEYANRLWKQCNEISKLWYRNLVAGKSVDSAPSFEILALLYWRMTWQGCTNPHILRRSFLVPMYGIAEWEAEQVMTDDIENQLSEFRKALDASWADWITYIKLFRVANLDWVTWKMRRRPRSFLRWNSRLS